MRGPGWRRVSHLREELWRRRRTDGADARRERADREEQRLGEEEERPREARAHIVEKVASADSQESAEGKVSQDSLAERLRQAESSGAKLPN